MLGEGGYAFIYAARDLATGTEYALKRFLGRVQLSQPPGTVAIFPLHISSGEKLGPKTYPLTPPPKKKKTTNNQALNIRLFPFRGYVYIDLSNTVFVCFLAPFCIQLTLYLKFPFLIFLLLFLYVCTFSLFYFIVPKGEIHGRFFKHRVLETFTAV